MSSGLEFLERERRDILTHMQAFPNDPYAAGKLAAIERDIEIASAIPLMGHMVNRPSSARKVEKPAKATFFNEDGSVDRVVHSDGRGNTVTVCGEDAVKVPASPDWKFIHSPERAEGLRGVAEAEALNNRLLAESLAKEKAPRYTFGADYEQDQLWLAAEREKTKGVREEQRTTVLLSITQEADLYAFPTMAFNLTSMHNLNYGTSRY